LASPLPSAWHPLFAASEFRHLQATRLVTLLLVRPFAPSRRLLRPRLTSRCASSGRRPFRREARSPQVRTRSFTAQSPHLRRLTFDHKSFAVRRPLALVGFASDAIRVTRLTVYVPHFLSTLGHPRAVVLPFARCGQLAGGLAPPGSRPCWAHVRSRSRACGALGLGRCGLGVSHARRCPASGPFAALTL